MFGPRTAPAGIRSPGQAAIPPSMWPRPPKALTSTSSPPGLAPSAFDISIQQNLLTVAGERRVEVPDGAQYYRQERFDGSFKRAITLPEDADPDKVNAAYVDGILHVAIQRREASRPRQIEVK